MSRFFLPGNFSTQVPIEPRITPSCPNNVYFKTLPQGNMNDTSYIRVPEEYKKTGQWPRKRIRMSPYGKSQLGVDPKTGEITPNYYPYMYTDVPQNTMYDSDLTRYDETGRYISSHFQAYPLMNERWVTEKRWYMPGCLPEPTIMRWQKYQDVSSEVCSNHS